MKLLSIIVFYLALGIFIWILKISFLVEYIHPKINFIFLFFLFLSYLNHLLFEIGWKNNREKLIQIMMGVQAFRFISSLIFIGLFGYFEVENIYLFVINFFVLYLFSTNFEIITLLRKLRRF